MAKAANRHNKIFAKGPMSLSFKYSASLYSLKYNNIKPNQISPSERIRRLGGTVKH